MKKYKFEELFATRLYMPEIQLSKEKEEISYISNVSGQFNIWEKKSIQSS